MASETRRDAGWLSRNADGQSKGKELDPGIRRDDEMEELDPGLRRDDEVWGLSPR